METLNSDPSAAVEESSACPSILTGRPMSFTRATDAVNLHSVLSHKEYRDLSCLSSEDVINHWKKTSPPYRSERPTVGEYILTSYLDPTFIAGVTDLQIIHFFQQKVVGECIPYVMTESTQEFDGLRMKRACVDIAAILGYSKNTPELRKYIQLVDVLKELPSHEARLVQAVLEKRMGPITALAASVTAENINFVMNKAKICNALPLFHQVFASPSLIGKLNAIWRLLELYELLWEGIPWVTVQMVVHNIYSAFSWLIEKCKMGALFISQGFTWTPAERVGEDEMQADGPTAEGLEVEKPLPHVNDCLYIAVAPQIDMDPEELKAGFVKWLHARSQMLMTSSALYNGAEEDNEESHKETQIELASGTDLKTSTTAMYLSEYIERNITIVSDLTDFAVDNINCRSTARLFVGHLGKTTRHFYACEPRTIQVVPVFGGEMEKYIHRDCHLCHKSHSQECPTCTKDVCVECFVKCCDNTIKDVTIPRSAFRPAESVKSDATVASEATGVTVLIKPTVAIYKPPETTDETGLWQRIKSFFDGLGLNELGIKIKDFLTNLFTDIYGWIKENPVAVGIMSLIASIGSLLGITIPTLTNPHDKRALISKIGDATRTVYNCQRTGSSIMEAAAELGEVVASTLGISVDNEIQVFKDRLSTLAQSAMAMLEQAAVNPAQFINSSQEMCKFEKELKEVRKIYYDLSRMNGKFNSGALGPLWGQLTRAASQLEALWIHFRACTSDRQEPVVLWLWGETNLGKSRLLNHITRSINKKTKRQLATFTVSKGPDFWNTFAGHKIIKIDDFGAWIGPEGNIDALSLFNLKTCAAFNPSLAGLEVKDLMADPNYVVIASNATTVPMNTGVSCVPAFERRRDFFIKVEWPEHTNKGCHKKASCDHIDELIAKKIETGEESFDHLTLSVCNPAVSEFSTMDDFTFKRKRTKPDQLIIGTNITVDGLVEAMIKKEELFNANFAITFNQAMREQADFSVDQWAQYPNVLILGPPGTGKTFLIKKLHHDETLKTRYIVGKEEFEALAKNEWNPGPGVDAILFDDTSSITTSEFFPQWCDEYKRRCDQPAETTILWIMCANEGILKNAIYARHNVSDEDFAAILELDAMYFRRAQKFTTSFKIASGISNFVLRKRYTAKDVIGANINEFVQYESPEGKPISQDTTLEIIRGMKPKVVEITGLSELPSIIPSTPSCMLEIDLESDEFLKLIEETSLAKLFMLLRSDKVKFSSGTLQVGDIVGKIAKSVSDARSQVGYRYASLDSFFLECSNNRFLAHFQDIKAYLILKDKAYSIEKGKFDYPVVHSLSEGASVLKQALESLASTSRSISAIDFLTFSTTNFSPWFCFAGNLIATVCKVGVSALSVTHSIVDQNKAHIAIRAHDEMMDLTKAYIQHETTKMPSVFGRNIYMNDRKRDKQAVALFTKDDDPHVRFRVESDPDEPRTQDPIKSAKKSWRDRNMESGTFAEPPDFDESAPSRNKRHQVRQQRMQGKGKNKRGFEALDPWTTTSTGLKNEYSEDTVRRNGLKQPHQAVVEVEALKDMDEIPIYQASTDPAALDVIMAVVPNMVTLYNDNNAPVCHALVIKKNLATTVWHIDNAYKSMKGIYALDGRNNKYKCRVVEEVASVDRIDFTLEGGTVPADFRDITKHLASASYTDFVSKNCVLITMARNSKADTPVLVIRSYRAGALRSKSCSQANMMVNLIEFTGHKMGYMGTDLLTRKGDCGSLLVVLDPGCITGKIIGMHSRANAEIGFARPIHREDYVNDELHVETLIGKYMGEAKPAEDPEDDTLVARATHRVYVPTKTRLYRNIAPVGERLYEPAILSSRDTRNPGKSMLKTEARKWLQKPPDLTSDDRNLLRQCAFAIAQQYGEVLSRNGAVLAVTTKREALNKYRHATQSEPIPVNTSAGYPWANMSRDPGKRGYIEVDERTGTRVFRKGPLVNSLHAAIDRFIHAAKTGGECEEPIFQVWLKDEPVKLKKIYDVDAAKTRTIAAAPLHFQILHRMYTHAGVCSIMDNHNEVSAAPGIDPTSPEWDLLFKQMLNAGTRVLALDYKDWDFNVHPFILCECIPLIWNYLYKLLDPSWLHEDDVVRNFIYKIISGVLLLIGMDIHRMQKGIASGISTTSNDNSLINEIKKLFTWVKTMRKKKPSLSGFEYYFKYIYRKYYGDDSVLVVPDFLLEYFNSLDIAKVEWEIFGCIVTSADKDSEVQESQDILDVTFMSRNFRLIGDRCYGKLEWPRVCKPTWWVHDTRSHEYHLDRETEVRNLDSAFSAYESALLECIPHGKTKFESVRIPAQKAFRERGYDKLLPDFDTLYAEMQGMPPPTIVTYGFHKENLTEELSYIRLRRPPVPVEAIRFKTRSTWLRGAGYKYAGAMHASSDIPPPYDQLLAHLNEKFKRGWNSILFNYYPPGGEIPWHFDNEQELDIGEGVGCLTLYGDGTIYLSRPDEPLYEFSLLPGDFYIMEEDCLVRYRHRRADHQTATLSLTFRKMEPSVPRLKTSQ